MTIKIISRPPGWVFFFFPPRWIENRFFSHVGLKKNFYLNIVNSWVSYERKWPVYYENGNRFGQKLWTKNINILKLHIKVVLNWLCAFYGEFIKEELVQSRFFISSKFSTSFFDTRGYCVFNSIFPDIWIFWYTKNNRKT